MIAIKNVLVATDFSPASTTALAYGRELARTFGGTLHVLHVVDDLSARLMYADAVVAGVAPPELQDEIERVGRRELDSAVSEADRRELRAVAVQRRSSNTAREIAEYSKEAAIDIIVIGATGRGAFDRMLMGSVAEKVIRRAPCPVLAVRNPEHEFLVPDALQLVEHSKA